jgi:hypothetical protein
MYCGLGAVASGAAIAAKRRELQWRAPAPQRAVEPGLDEPLELVIALTDLPFHHQVVGAVCIALFLVGLYFYFSAESFFREVLSAALMIATNYALYGLVRDARRRKRAN